MTKSDSAAQVVNDPAAGATAVLAAVDQVAASEPASLWSGVANDARFPIEHRSLAAWQLIKRHVRPGDTVGAVATRLAGAVWLDTAELEKITAMGGELPIAIPAHGAAFIVRLPRGASVTVPDLGAYLAFDRDSDAATLRAALSSRPAGAGLAGAHITGVAMFPDSLTAPR
jgi:hypothetical protein